MVQPWLSPIILFTLLFIFIRRSIQLQNTKQSSGQSGVDQKNWIFIGPAVTHHVVWGNPF